MTETHARPSTYSANGVSRLDELGRRREEARAPGSAEAMRTQRRKGKLTARERIERLLDPGSFVELDEFVRHRVTGWGMADRRPYGDGVVTGHGTVDGRPICVFSQDFTVFGGTLGEAFGQKIVKVLDLALRTGCPVVGINDGAGGRIQEGVAAQALYGEIFYRNVAASGVIPQISMIMGPCAGGAVYSPAITDFTVMVEGTSHMFITGPEVISATNGERIGLDELGGARVHGSRSGCTHYAAADEEDAFDYVKTLLAYLPSNNLEEPPLFAGDPGARPSHIPELDGIVPGSPREPYDMRAVISAVVDGGELLEVSPDFAANIVVGFARLDGHSIGIVANQPAHLSGCLDIDASEKAARFVRLCDAFNIPILTFVDTPGFLPGADQEWNGIIRRGAKLIYAYAEATVPLMTVVTGKAYGGGYVVMGSKHLHADVNLAWPSARIAVMGARGAVSVLYRRELAVAPDPELARARFTDDYESHLETPYAAAERGYVDAIVAPSETRAKLTAALRLLQKKREQRIPRKHGNIPL
ncbi:acyl-CoA carboxylase subunit beta [Frankia sp. CiP3]|uniref:acyl-CoA carboxylase subunit beta n=1 Tax=Frankia sp. CiP3 TaxID=2880971 RepID=UPI001EF605A4|nr:acyl-CoA carboxylase subunit beta [Frankia sp. CiP3]